MKKTIKGLFILAVSVVLSSSAFAATDGTLGLTSQGDADITVGIGEMVRISGFEDFAFGTYSGNGALTDNDDLCVYRNGNATYTITATSNEGSFQVRSGVNAINYTASFNDQTGTVGSAALVYNTATSTQTGANTQTADCSQGGNSANLKIDMTEADIQAAPPGSYSGTIVLTAAPV